MKNVAYISNLKPLLKKRTKAKNIILYHYVYIYDKLW